MIVLTIIAIMATLVVPHFSNAGDTAKASNLTTQMKAINTQLQLAKLQHRGVYPDLSASWDYMVMPSDPSSTPDGQYAPADGDADDVGPYLGKVPVNPFQDSSVVADTAGPGVGWVYDRNVGTVKAVVPEAIAVDVGLVGDALIVTYTD